jgi:rod shape determining protein RodA
VAVIAQQRARPTPLEKLRRLSWPFVLLVVATAAVGLAVLYSAANGDLDPWAARQAVRLAVGIGVMLVIALVDVRVWHRYAYVIYGLALAGLVAVEVSGTIGKGAQRWLDVGPLQLQPSEVMKIALILALARYFHGAYLHDLRRPLFLLPPAVMIVAPAALVLKQPDLGTAIMLLGGGAVLLFAAGVRWWIFAAVGLAGAGAVPVAWNHLHDYQKRRVLTFLDPENDPLGAGYHITQSKIAFGSGGVFGRGFMQGTQSHLNFLPEKHTDFIFTMLAEEFGMVGALGLMGLYALLISYGIVVALRCGHQFGRLLAIGVTTTFSLFVFINIAMVTGLIPVVGIPLPLVSYGGTALMTVLVGFGLLLCVRLHRDAGPRRAGDDAGA